MNKLPSKTSSFLTFIYFFLLLISTKVDAQNNIDSLISVLTSDTSSYTTKAKTSNNLGKIYWSTSKFENALISFQQTLSIYEKNNDSTGISKALANLGVVNQSLGNYNEAITYYISSLKLKIKFNDKKGVCNTYNNIAVTYDYIGISKKSLEYFQKALALSIEIDYPKITATAYNGIGVIFNGEGRLDEALSYFLKSVALKKEIDYQYGLQNTYGNIADIYSKKNNFFLALSFHQKSLEIAKKNNDLESEASSLIMTGFLHNEFKKHHKALTYFKSGIKIAKQIRSNELLKSAYEGIASSFQKLNQNKKALKYFLLYIEKKDSLFNIQISKQITEIQTEFDVYQKEQKIVLLNKNKEIQAAKITEIENQVIFQKALKHSIASFAFVLLIIGFLLFYNYRIRKINKEQQLQKQNLDTENKLLRTQMNPHFIFNSLNSIQNYILKNEADTASNYVSDFARLMRAILNNSKHIFIALSNETETLELYLKLEQVRFDNKFSFHINYDNDLETDFILIPPMIIQPFIENAIIHGILNKKNAGKINIHIKDKEDLIYCSIEDDGIGRKEAQKIKSSTLKKEKHSSMGVEISQNRINLLNKELGTKGKIIFIDLFNDTNEACGTKVELYIPIKP